MRFNNGVDPAADKKIAGYLHLPRPDRLDEVIEDPIDDCLVEVPFIAVGPQIKFQGLQFNAFLIRDIIDRDGRKVRLSCFGAHATKFRTGETDFVIALRLRVWKSLDGFLRCRRHFDYGW